jgi:hypothetical protein
VQGTFTINGVGSALNVSDAADHTSVATTITATDIQSGSAGDIIYNGPSTVSFIAGKPTDGFRNAIDVESAVSGSSLVLTTIGNSDVGFSQAGLDFSSALSGVGITLSGTSSDSLTLNDQFNPANTTYAVSDTSVDSGSAGVSIVSSFGQVIVLGGSGTNHFDVTPSTTTTFSLDGGSGTGNTLTYHTPSSPSCAPHNDGVFSITDANGHYQPVYYYDFMSEGIM